MVANPEGDVVPMGVKVSMIEYERLLGFITQAGTFISLYSETK